MYPNQFQLQHFSNPHCGRWMKMSRIMTEACYQQNALGAQKLVKISISKIFREISKSRIELASVPKVQSLALLTVRYTWPVPTPPFNIIQYKRPTTQLWTTTKCRFVAISFFLRLQTSYFGIHSVEPSRHASNQRPASEPSVVFKIQVSKHGVVRSINKNPAPVAMVDCLWIATMRDFRHQQFDLHCSLR